MYCMYVCMYVCIVCIDLLRHIIIRVRTHIHTYIYIHTYTHTHIRTYTHTNHTYTQQVSESTFLDLFLLSECDAFVGTFFSHFSRIAYELMVSRHGDFMPYVSVDLPWAPVRPVSGHEDVGFV